jgi:hypothetical protein
MRIVKPRNTTETQAPATQPPAPASKPAPAVITWPGQELLKDPVGATVLESTWRGNLAVVVPSPPGSGKTRLTTHLGGALSERAGLRVGIAAQTRAQAIDISRRLAAICNPVKIGLLWRKTGAYPDVGSCPLIHSGREVWPGSGGAVRVATTAKWLRAQPGTLAADVLIIDEAFQATYADIGALSAMANQIVCVGDPGQIDPVVTGDVSRWQGSPTGPHLPAPHALSQAFAADVTTVALKHTWRLGPETTAMVQSAFYPRLPFTSRRPPEHLAIDGTVLPELAHRELKVANGSADAGLIAAAVTRTRQLIDTATLTTAEGTRPVRARDVAVIVPHVSQAAAIRALLGDHPDTLVGTANALQGQERAAVVAIHPMAGKRIVDQFSVETGRLCVMLSRHRSHLSLLIDEQTAAVFDHDDESDTSTVRAVLDTMLGTAQF